MPLEIVRNDITKMKVDAIVNAANESLLGGGGVDGAIHEAAGPGLLEECRKLGGCAAGQAKATGAYRLPCKYVIHTVGPRWAGGRRGERDQLLSCYRSSLAIALEKGCETVAFPLISSGIFGYPKDQALQVAVEAIGEFLLEHDMTVYLVIFDKKSFQIGEELFSDIEQYIDDRYASEHVDERRERMRPPSGEGGMDFSKTPGQRLRRNVPDGEDGAPLADAPHSLSMAAYAALPAPSAAPISKKGTIGAATLDEAIMQMDESFSDMLFRKIDERGITDAACYKKANIDRRLFSKIRSDREYRPSKPTVLALAIALELPLPEVREMLMKAGFALSHSNKSDIIVEYFISRGNYNIYEINEALFAFDQSLLGA